MNISAPSAAFAAILCLYACAGAQFTVPITGQLTDGTAATGEATARIDGNGTFWVKIPGGPKCSGSYDALATNPTIVVPVECDDGRKGESVIARRAGGLSGTAIVTLADGTKGQFVFGDLTYNQAFGSGAAKTQAEKDGTPAAVARAQ